MKLFQSANIDEESSCIWGGPTAWINRFTVTYRNRYPVEIAEIWVVWLPSYGMEYSPYTDEFLWSQRGFRWNLRTGEFCKVVRVVKDK